MAMTIPTTERAIELAASGQCRSVNEIRQTLRREGREDVHLCLASPAINRELIVAMKAAATQGVVPH